MKRNRIAIIFLLIFTVFITGNNVSHAQAVDSGQAADNEREIAVAAELKKIYRREIFFQDLSLDSTSFNGKYATGFHIRPAWRWKRFEGRFDFAFYQNPWDDYHWQWGIPQPDTKPDIPNFVDNITYRGDRFNVSYQKINDLNFGYGLLINDYHLSKPYRGWNVQYTPADTTKLTYIASQEFIYLAPFEKNDCASLQILQADQSLNTGWLNWQLGLTGIYDGYSSLNQARFPTGGVEYDLTLTNLVWCSPFWATTELDDGFGGANMLGLKGRLGLVSYQAGYFRTHGRFAANYFGGRYEDLKWNSWSDNGKPGLAAISFLDGKTSDGLISRLWIESSPWLNISLLNIADDNSTTGFSLTGSIERLGMVYGFFYYNQFQNQTNYDYFLRGGNGFVGYEYRYRYDWDGSHRHELEVDFKF
jgi:hypothetical protein